jgi:hypothetical protein
MARLLFDRARVDLLRLALGAALDDLRAIRNSDPAAADVMRSLANNRRTLEETWLPRVHDVLNSTAMTSCTRSAPGVPDLAQSKAKYLQMHNDGWEVIAEDPLVVYGPPAPHLLNGDEVLKAIESGALQPMDAPIDAHGRANANYTSIAFAPGTPPPEIGYIDMTSNAAKVLDFFSDGLPVGWRETDELFIYRIDDVRVIKGFHTLTAYDRDEGPDTMTELTQEAIGSGYMAIAQRDTVGEVTRDIGYGDPTAHHAIASQSTSAYSGAFYPDPGTELDFQPITHEDRFVSPALWTFTTSASPMVDGWGTWQVSGVRED